MQVKTKTSIIFVIFLCLAFAVSCGGSSKKEETPETDTVPDENETTDEDEAADTDDETADDSEVESVNASVSSIKFKIPEEASTVAEFSGHFAFPDVVRLKSGKFMVVYRNGSSHADKSGAIIVSLSDDGVNWGEPDILLNDDTIDDRDPSITVFSDGRVGMNWFKYRYPADYSEPWVHHLFFAVSDSSGLNFGEHIQVDGGVFDYSETAVMDENGIWLDDENGSEVTVAASSSSMIEDGEKIIIPGYFGNALNWQSMSKTPKTRVVLYESSDGGRTWSPNEVKAEIDEKTWLQEPALLKVTDKRWIIQARTGVGSSPSNKGDMVQTVSEDGGKTWSAYKSLGFVAHAPELLKLENGVIVSSFRWLDWGTSVSREAVSMVYSLDGGETWSDVIEILDCGKAECGYPGMVELPDNKILIVYYTPGGTGIESKIITFEAE
ncbi:exo-alpha-sialidase [bacterium]|nr:exo-alpha-sialidase [bacterium]